MEVWPLMMNAEVNSTLRALKGYHNTIKQETSKQWGPDHDNPYPILTFDTGN